MQIILTYEILEKEKNFIIELLSVFKANLSSCLLIHQETLTNILPFISPSIIITKNAGFEFKNWYKKAKNAGHISFCFDSEGLFLNPKDLLNVKVCTENLEILEKYFLYGEYQESLLKEKYPSYKNKFQIVGSPAIDFLKKNIVFYSNHERDKLSIKFNTEKLLIRYLNKNKCTKSKKLKNKIVLFDYEKICFGINDPSHSSSKRIFEVIEEIIKVKSEKNNRGITNAYKIYIYFLSIIAHLIIIIKNPIYYLRINKSNYGSRFEIVNLNKQIQNCTLKNNLVTFCSRIITF